METNSNWLIDYEMMDDISSAVSATAASFPPSSATIDFSWATSQTVNYSSTATGAGAGQLEDTEVCKESRSRKRLRLEGCIPPGTKACREKMRRDLINERFLELSSILEPTRPPKTDKIAILSGAGGVVTSLRNEIKKLKESNLELVDKIHELKAEKMELRDEKQKLKEDKKKLEQQVETLLAKTCSLGVGATLNMEGGQVAGGKKMAMPFVGYPGFAMWQFMQPAIVDTSQDHVLHPPVA